MTNGTYKKTGLIKPRGGYRKLKSYQAAEIVYDLTVRFTKKYIRDHKLKSQLNGAARSGKQNIAEGSMDSGISSKIEIKLVGVARGSLEELLLDFEDFLRQKGMQLWKKDDNRSGKIRKLAYMSDRSYKTYMTFLAEPEKAANCIICLIHQANYLLDKQIARLERDFLKDGGFTERMYRKRKKV